MKKSDPDDFRVRPNKPVDLGKWPTLAKPVYHSQDECEAALTDHVQKLSEQQSLLYASDSYSLLLIFQAMDAAGKDSMIKHVMSGINPQGCQVYSFKHPAPEDLDHDFPVERDTPRLPERGHIGIFNRSYYEEVLIVRVHREILKGERLPPELMDDDATIWHGPLTAPSSNPEKHLHLQRHPHRQVLPPSFEKTNNANAFLKRIDEPEKNWKFQCMDDVRERKYWPQYMRAYEECLSATSILPVIAPRYIVPADDKQNARLIVSRIILDAFEDLKNSRIPKPTPACRRELLAIRKQLAR